MWAAGLLFALWLADLVWYKPFSINFFYERMFWEYLSHFPEQMSQLGYYEKYGLKSHQDKLNSNTGEGFTETVLTNYDMLLSYKRGQQDITQRFNTDLLAYYLEEQILLQQFVFFQYPIDQLDGFHVRVPVFMESAHTIRNVDDANNYLERLLQIDKLTNETVQSLLLREETGAIPPRPVLEKVLAQIDKIVGEGVEGSFFYKDFSAKAARLRQTMNLPQTAVDEFLYLARERIGNDVLPSYTALALELKKLLPKTDSLPGVWRYGEGGGYYALQLKKNLSTDQGRIANEFYPDSLMRLAQEETANILAEYDSLLVKTGFPPRTPFPEVLEKSGSGFEVFYSDDSLGRKAFVNDFNLTAYNFLEWARQHSKLPVADLPVATPMPAWLAEGVPGFLYVPTGGGSGEAARLYLNLADMHDMPRCMKPVLAAGLVAPGLHLQSETQREQTALPVFRNMLAFPALTDGWQHMARHMALQNGLIGRGQPLEHLALLHHHLVLAVKMQADLGMHHYQWEWEEAVAFLQSEAWLTKRRAAREAMHCAVDPGRACAYLVGYHALKQQDGGSGFGPEGFLVYFMRQGAVPLDMLPNLAAFYQSKHLGGRR